MARGFELSHIIYMFPPSLKTAPARFADVLVQFCLSILSKYTIVKLQPHVPTSVLGLGVDFVLPLSQQQQQQQQQEPHQNIPEGNILEV